MRFLNTELAGAIIVEPDVYRDERGFLLESYQVTRYREGGITATFVQDNHSFSGAHVLRGLHGQRRRPQGKLVRVVRGEIFDVAVDVRRGSPTFRRWVGLTLSADNFRQLYVPPGFLHGFCVVGERAEVEYKCTDYYDREDQVVVRWNDAELAIAWPLTAPLLSAQDASAPSLADVVDELPGLAECP